MQVSQKSTDDLEIVNGRSAVTHAILTADSRYNKALKIHGILKHFQSVGGKRLLDIGTGSGHIAEYFARNGAIVSSVDTHDQRLTETPYEFIKVESERLPFESSKFDIVITNHVIEHVPDQKLHMAEIERVLKPGGIAYLATPSKFTILEPHYRLPFLSYFPALVASAYLKLVRGKVWDIQPLSLSRLQALCGSNLKVEYVSPRIMKQPTEYHLDMAPSLHKYFAKVPLSAWRSLAPLLPAIIVVIRKSAPSTS